MRKTVFDLHRRQDTIISIVFGKLRLQRFRLVDAKAIVMNWMVISIGASRTKKSASIRVSSRFRTTYSNTRKETPQAERSCVCYCVNSKGPNFRVSQSTDSDGLAVGYVKREETLFFDGDDSLLWVIAPSHCGANRHKNTIL